MHHLQSLRLPFAALSITLLAACGGSESEPSDAPEADVVDTPAQTMEAVETGLLNPNEANAEALMAVPGMTAELVDAVVAARPFSNMLEVDALLGEALDEAARGEVYRMVFIPIDLNGASEAEMLLIPGVDDHMAYEFDEYRPYDEIERFRTEIGKYVDEAEVARLEQYVEIR